MLNSPWYLLLLLVLPWIAYRLFAKRRQMAIRFTSVAIAKQMTRTVRQRLLWLPKVLAILSLAFLVLGLARPREGRERTIVDSDGIAIEMVVDRSGSMRALDFQIEGENVDRLTAIKNVAGKFVKGEDDLDGRYSDLVGLITFAGFADGVTPPTLDHTFLVANLNKTQIVSEGSEDGTAIGDAIALAVEKLNALDDRQKEKVKSKVIILLTDGENTAGELDPLAAAELAQAMGIKVYTIGVGTKGQAPIPVRDRFSGRKVVRWMPVNIDEATLKKVAEATDGKYFRATDTESLTKIYEEIDALEKTKVEADNFVDYRELAVQPYRAGFLAVPPILLIAFLLMLARVVLQNTWLKEVV
ncbi:MAG: VWA domain-containing protein [Pirellulaceae bacterium]|nr:VWA domain-containing protein [Pirellulaceae bacterium]